VAKYIPPVISIDPIASAWELTKLSFVVDWYINVGQWIAALELELLASKTAAASGIYGTVTRQVVDLDTDWVSGWSGDRTFGSTISFEVTERWPDTIALTPLRLVNLNAAKILDLVAIIIDQTLPRSVSVRGIGRAVKRAIKSRKTYTE
jgi:hypothetical protein